MLDSNFMQHEDVQLIPVVAGEENADPLSDHGTMVAGIIGAKDNQSGNLGIAPNVTLLGAVVRADRTLESHKVIRAVANILNPGDIMVMCQQRSGPLFQDGQGELGKLGAILFEWWEEDFQAIRYATQRGIIFISSAGNGDSDLTAAALDAPYSGAPGHWTNPFKRVGARDSGSILVGAASPGQPRLTNWGTLGSRLGYSNFGSCVDASSWGREVTIIKSLNASSGAPGNWYYTSGTGTSVSAPIVAGVLASVQGALKAAGKPLLTPATARAALRATGRAQVSGAYPASQRIGPMVNLRDLYEYVGVVPKPVDFNDPPQVPVGPLPSLTTTPFLTANGVRIPIELGSARRTNNRDKTERALSGAPLTSRFDTKESFAFKTVSLTAQEAAVVNSLFLGRGEGCDYRGGDLYTAKGQRDLSGAVFKTTHGYHGSNFLDPGIHPAYRVSVMDNVGRGTFYVGFTAQDFAGVAGILAMFYGNGVVGTTDSFTPYSEIQLTANTVRLQVIEDRPSVGFSSPYLELPRSVLRNARVNVAAVSWGPDGETAFAVNGELAFNNMPNPRWKPYTPFVALGERWGDTSRGTWADGGTRPLNCKVGQWAIWPVQVLPDDLRRMSDGFFNANHGSAPPYLKAGGTLITSNLDIATVCEGRVVGMDYQEANRVQLSLEMDEV